MYFPTYNEDGEFLMTATELRTEWELDQLSAAEEAEERFYDYEPDEDADDDGFSDEDDFDPMEDAWLDGSYEE